MGLRAVIYVLILGLGLFGATGLGFVGPASKSTVFRPSVSVAAPLAGEEENGEEENGEGENGEGENGEGENGDEENGEDNGEDNGSGDNGEDNGSGDNGEDNGSGDNGDDNEAVSASSSSSSSGSGSSGSSGAPPPTTQQASGPPTQSGPCWFVFGFKDLHDLIPGIVGDCRTNEIHSENGDGLQYTAGGLMVWRKADNWTAFTNGAITWLNGPCGLQTRPNEGPFYGWEGKIGSPCVALESEEAPLAQEP